MYKRQAVARYLDFRAHDVVKNVPVSDPVREAVPKILNRFTLFAQKLRFRSWGGSLCCFRPECGNFCLQFIQLELQSPQFLLAGLQLLIGLLLFYLGSLQLFLLFHKETALQLLGNMLIRIDHENQKHAQPGQQKHDKAVLCHVAVSYTHLVFGGGSSSRSCNP